MNTIECLWLNNLIELDNIRDTDTYGEAITIISCFKKYGSEASRGLNIHDLEIKLRNVYRMSHTKIRQNIVLLYALGLVTYTEKIGNNIFYKLTDEGVNLLNKEKINEKEKK